MQTLSNTSDRVWLDSYPQGVPADIDPDQYSSLVALMEESFARYADRTAYSFVGKNISYRQTDEDSTALAAYLQSLGLSKGDRVAIMMPNVPQYPIAVAAVLRAGYVVVNVNPLYTPRELAHQLNDAGVETVIIFAGSTGAFAVPSAARKVRWIATGVPSRPSVTSATLKPLLEPTI